MKHITLEQLLSRKQELMKERDHKMLVLSVGYENAIAVIDELISTAMAVEDVEPNMEKR